MGLFSRKSKTPKIPFPEGDLVDERSLRFSQNVSVDKIIEPNSLKMAAGVDEPPMLFPMSNESKREEMIPEPPSPIAPPMQLMDEMENEEIGSTYINSQGPLFVKKEVYISLLQEVDEVVKHIGELRTCGGHLIQSEYNEETQFSQFKKQLKTVHDKILQMDTALFKAR